MNYNTLFAAQKIIFDPEKKSPPYQAVQIIRLFLHAKQENHPLILPTNCNKPELDSFAQFLSDYREAFNDTKKGLPKEFYCGESLFSSDEKKLYLFIFANAETQIMVKGLYKNRKNITYLSSGKSVQLDETIEPWNGVNTLWLKLNSAEMHPMCTAVCISCAEPIKLYHGTGIHLFP